MTREIRTVYRGKRNKGLSSTFQPPEEDRSVQRPKCCHKHGDKGEDNCPKNVNNLLFEESSNQSLASTDSYLDLNQALFSGIS